MFNHWHASTDRQPTSIPLSRSRPPISHNALCTSLLLPNSLMAPPPRKFPPNPAPLTSDIAPSCNPLSPTFLPPPLAPSPHTRHLILHTPHANTRPTPPWPSCPPFPPRPPRAPPHLTQRTLCSTYPMLIPVQLPPGPPAPLPSPPAPPPRPPGPPPSPDTMHPMFQAPCDHFLHVLVAVAYPQGVVGCSQQ